MGIFSVCIPMHICMSGAFGDQRSVWWPENGVTGDCETSCGWLDTDQGPLEEWSPDLTNQSSHHPWHLLNKSRNVNNADDSDDENV